MSSTTSLTSREAALVSSVGKGLFIGGEWRPASGGRVFAVEDPSTGEHRRGRRRHRRGRHRRPGRRRRRAGRLGRHRPPRARRDPAPGVRAADRAVRGHRAADDPGDGQAAAPRPAARSPTAPSSSAGSPRRPCGSPAAARSRPNGGTRLLTMKQPVGPAVRDHPVELPAGHGHPQDRPGAGRRLHRGDQARRADPVDHAGSRRGADRGGAAGRGGQRDHHVAAPAP